MIQSAFAVHANGLPAGIVFTQAAARSGDVCDRAIDRRGAAIPNVDAAPWELKDAGQFTFQYRFFVRAGSDQVMVMETTGQRAEGFVTRRLAWEIGNEIHSLRFGAEAGDEPICVRTIRGGFNLERLYQTLKPRLKR